MVNIKFKRTRYINKFTKEVKALVDDHIGIVKYERIIAHLKYEILDRVLNVCRYRDVVDALKYSEISEMTISNVIKKLKISKEALNELSKPKNWFIS